MSIEDGGRRLDLELHLGLPSSQTAFDLDLNVDLMLFAGPIPAENLALELYERPVAVGGDGVPVPPGVTESVTVGDVEMGGIVIQKGLVGRDDAVTEVGVLATMDEQHV